MMWTLIGIFIALIIGYFLGFVAGASSGKADAYEEMHGYGDQKP